MVPHSLVKYGGRSPALLACFPEVVKHDRQHVGRLGEHGLRALSSLRRLQLHWAAPPSPVTNPHPVPSNCVDHAVARALARATPDEPAAARVVPPPRVVVHNQDRHLVFRWCGWTSRPGYRQDLPSVRLCQARLLSVECGSPAFPGVTVRDSQHRSIAASQLRSFAASQHRSIAASQHGSIAASQHRSFAARAQGRRSTGLAALTEVAGRGSVWQWTHTHTQARYAHRSMEPHRSMSFAA